MLEGKNSEELVEAKPGRLWARRSSLCQIRAPRDKTYCMIFTRKDADSAGTETMVGGLKGQRSH